MDIKLHFKAKTRKSSVFPEQMKGSELDVSLAAVISLHSIKHLLSHFAYSLPSMVW